MKDELGEKIMMEFVGLRAKRQMHKKVCHKKNNKIERL